jgi:MFS family permease
MFALGPRTAAGVFFAVQGACFASWGSRIANIQEQLGLSEAQLGLILLTLPVGSLAATPLSGMAVSRFGSQHIVRWAACAYALTLVGVACAQSLWQLACVLTLFGAAGTVLNIAVNAQGVAVEAYLRRSVMASFHGLWSLAGFLSAAFGGALVGAQVPGVLHYGVVAVGVCVTTALVSPHLLKDEPRPAGSPKPRRMPDRQLLQLGLVALCAMICEGTMFDWSGVYFRKVVHAPTALGGAGYAAYMGTMASGRFLTDRWAGRYGWVSIVRFSGGLIAAGLLLSAAVPLLPVATIGFMMVGAGTSSVVPLVYGQAGKSQVLSPSMALSAVSTIGFFGFLLGPPLIGLLAQWTNLQVAFGCIALMGLMVRRVVQTLADERTAAASTP